MTMANTFDLIAKQELTGSAASVTFSSIPQTYSDLLLRYTSRQDATDWMGNPFIRFNGSSASNYSYTWVRASNTASSGRSSADTWIIDYSSAANATANTFGANEIYIPNYISSTAKPLSQSFVGENNSTTSYIVGSQAGLWNQTAAITSISLLNFSTGLFVAGSLFYLYGIKNT